MNQKKKNQKLKQRISRKKSSIVDKGLRIQIGDYLMSTAELLGKGSYGDVYKAYHNQSGQLFACKVISKSQLDKLQLYDKEKVQQLRKRLALQISFHKSLNTANNIVKLYEMLQDDKAYYLIMQYCEQDLSKYLKRLGPLPQNQAWNFFKQLVSGYQNIYEKKASHRDLKPQNLLISKKQLKISDFGFVKIFNDAHNFSKSAHKNIKAETIVGTCRYMSPDILMTQINKKGYNPQKSDIWSIGIILYKMLYGTQPYKGKNQTQILKEINENQVQFDKSIQVSENKISLINKLIQKDQSKRLSFLELVDEIKLIDDNEAQLLQNQSKYLDKSLKIMIVNSKNSQQQKIKKQKLLTFLNQLNKKIYHDTSNYATLRQIGYQDNYLSYAYKLMTLIHEKRLNCLENQANSNDEDVNQDIKKQIAQYHNIFYLPIKMHSKLQETQTLATLLQDFIEKLLAYKEFHLHGKDVQFFLLNLVMLYNFETKRIKIEEIQDIFDLEFKKKKFTDIKDSMCKLSLSTLSCS